MKTATTTSPKPKFEKRGAPFDEPLPPTVPHPNMKGSEPRTRLAGGPFVDTTTTLAQFTAWAKSGVSQGVIIDRLTQHALKTDFDPVTNSYSPKVSPGAPKSHRG